MENWNDCRNILVIRPDNIGDVLMSAPAIRALKQSFGSRITLLTSEAGAAASALLPQVDDTLVVNLPWVKHPAQASPMEFKQLAERLQADKFDGCVIFTVYSQNPLPTAVLAWMAGIPRRLAYCRENPYELLSHWVPDDEPYSRIRHQVARDLDLVKHVGAYGSDERISISIPSDATARVRAKLAAAGVQIEDPYVIFHAGVSESKRAFPPGKWIALAKRLLSERPVQVLFTGTAREAELTDHLRQACGSRTVSVAGLLDITEFAAAIRQAGLVVSVNTATIHLAAALRRPLVALYALTNPQHTPWCSPHAIFPYSVSAESKNEVIRYVNKSLFNKRVGLPSVDEVLQAIDQLLRGNAEQQPIHQSLFH